MALTLNIKGIPEVNAAIQRAATRSVEGTRAAVSRNLENTARDTRGFSPVDEGDQRSTVRVELDEDGLGGRVVVGGIPGTATGKMVDYADANELGVTQGARAGKHPVQPSLTPAFEQNRAPFLRDLKAVAQGKGDAVGAAR